MWKKGPRIRIYTDSWKVTMFSLAEQGPRIKRLEDQRQKGLEWRRMNGLMGEGTNCEELYFTYQYLGKSIGQRDTTN